MPAIGQVLPLKFGWYGIATVNFPVKVTNVWDIYYTGHVLQSTSGFQFVALPGHPDGAGSVIVFEFRYSVETLNNAGIAVTEMYISARVLNDFGAVSNAAYRQGALNPGTSFPIIFATT